MIVVVADTHALIWSLFNDPRLSPAAKQAMEDAIAAGNDVGVSAITVVELVYLVEKSKLPLAALDRTLQELRNPSSSLTAVPLTDVIAEMMKGIARADVPDMPDRIIAATALHLGVPVISKDAKIRLSAVPTIW